MPGGRRRGLCGGLLLLRLAAELLGASGLAAQAPVGASPSLPRRMDRVQIRRAVRRSCGPSQPALSCSGGGIGLRILG
jgi:hypothetical protein